MKDEIQNALAKANLPPHGGGRSASGSFHAGSNNREGAAEQTVTFPIANSIGVYFLLHDKCCKLYMNMHIYVGRFARGLYEGAMAVPASANTGGASTNDELNQ